MKKKLIAMFLSVATLMTFGGCGSAASNSSDSASGGSSKNLIVYCPHPIEFIDPIVNEFENQSGVSVEVVTAGSGELLKRIESEGDNPLGDVMWEAHYPHYSQKQIYLKNINQQMKMQ
ncbi:hypothetical protein FBD77_08190 [Clostridium butyricum]|nr:hypothetical protein [Clostridium butyricum]